MAEKMLIDASHSEETRVVVVRGNRIEEFDFESEHKKQIRGNIYLAKVTRVEPSLQAAFVDYGGNRHGFLAFAEIHPDYYQIPLADRQALLKAEAEEARRDDDEPNDTVAEQKFAPAGDTVAEVVAQAEAAEAAGEAAEAAAEKPKPKAKAKPKRTRRAKPKAGEEAVAPESGPSEDGEGDKNEMAAVVDTDSISEDIDARRQRDDDDDDDNHDGEKEIIESVGAEDAMEEVADRHIRKPRKQYRIQEVIKRRQILLVQVAKEERGNKGAALTTYLSLAGRYSVLMPNTARGGGISRKITNLQDRKRLKEIARGLDVPQGMGVILRTAGANRTKVEIKRDFEYLMRLWENVRTLTLNSTAPCLVYEEGSLIKRSIRDLYNKDISEIVVSGEEGYKEAKGFMKMLMPSHAKVVQPYRDVHPIFSRSGIEAQLDRMLQPQVTLKSGGYIIINQTEALVSIDVNSGRSTREHSIEDTALQTNLEAAEEVARQLRLRDLAGLIVIDFIDMEEKRNNRSVEKKLKDCLKNDRARIQVGRISHFGLLEMSRQRIRASVLESTMQTCPHCNGTGHIRSQSSVALHVLRGIEEHLLKNTTHDISVRTTPDIALYLLNQKRSSITDYEQRFGVSIFIEADAHVGAQHFAIDRGEPVENPVRIDQILQFEPEPEDEEEVLIEEESDEEEVEEIAAERQDPKKGQTDEQGGRKRKRRRRRRGKGAGQGADEAFADAADAAEDETGDEAAVDDAEDEVDATDALNGDSEQKRKRRRRGKRGGRRSRQDELAEAEGETGMAADAGEGVVDDAEAEVAPAEETSPDIAAAAAVEAAAEEPKPAKPRRSRKKAVKAEEPAESVDEVAEKTVEAQPEATEAAPEAVEEAVADLEGAKPARANRDLSAIATEPVVTSSKGEGEEEPTKPKKGGWWQRRGFF
ncbi:MULTISPECIES: Rne/Rng family ribonuclease [Sinorhizobium]|jgi:ribonuclease E|uniref:Ribonuclease E n=2 Tax=Sinorhizobium TaxID=28105 RepID=H0G5R5_RHIML|nr:MULTISPECIES: ribonuclease E/G [Sinorhizobium]ASP84685.1 ribonuclease E/G [Sinorhizobium meliloti]EHK75369.1 ribonuclease E [Sinorhizobium meliloti CCNWSX0020]KKA16025.1 ribonuclease [Sinorhizobium meliloti]MQW29745.1 Rne/Rng family ribonuclease [Sinorhizobium meliloti]QGJ73780.1 ribonuclease E/G [Sinorhizobium meliloti]